jgi:hypothetical protein
MDELRQLNKNIRELATNIKYQFEKLAANIGGHINDTMTDEMALIKDTFADGFETVKGAGLGVYNFFRKSFNFEKGMMKETKKQTGLQKSTIEAIYDTSSAEYMKAQTKLMQQTVNLGKKDEARKRGMMGKKGKGMWDYLMEFLGIPFLIAGAAIGAIVGVIVAPFRLIYAMFKQLKFFEAMGGILKLIPGVRKVFGWMGKLWEGIKSLERIPILGKLVTGFVKGFTKLFWPIQIIMSVVDFIEGYQNSNGDIFDKVKSGVKNVIMKFIEWPMNLLERAWNWLAKELGFEGVAEGTFMKKAGKGIDWVFDIIPKMWKWFEGFISWMWEGVKEAFKFMKDRDWDFMTIVKDLLMNILQPIYDWLNEQVKKVLDWFKPDEAKAAEMTARISDAERRMIEMKGIGNAKQLLRESKHGGYADELIKRIEETSKDEKEVLKKIAQLLEKGGRGDSMVSQIMNSTGQGGGATAPPPVAVPSPKINAANSVYADPYGH